MWDDPEVVEFAHPGIAGALVLAMIWVKILLMCAGNYFKSRDPLFLGLFGATLAVVVASFFLPVFYYSTAMSFYWGLVALSMGHRSGDADTKSFDVLPDKRL